MQLKLIQILGAALLPWSTPRIMAAAVEVLKPGEILCAVWIKSCIPLMVACVGQQVDGSKERQAMEEEI